MEIIGRTEISRDIHPKPLLNTKTVGVRIKGWRGRSLAGTIRWRGGGGRDRAFAGGWRDSDGGATDRHYSTIHSVAQSYVTKAFHLQAHCGNPGDINCRGSLPLSAPETDLSTPPTSSFRGESPPSNAAAAEGRGGGHVRLFPCVLRIPLPCGGSVLLRFQPTLPLSERGSCA